MKKYRSLLLFLGFFTLAYPQGKPLSGRVLVIDATPMDVHVINVGTEQETITDKDGRFTISASPEDVLVFSAMQLDLMRHIVEAEDFAKGITVNMTSKIEMLDEVQVVNYHLNAVSLGILTKPAKQYTPAERKLYTATSGKLDYLINALSGRLKMLKRAREYEGKNILLEKLDGLFPDEFYTENLSIPKDRIKAFHYYLAERTEFAQTIAIGNKGLSTFAMFKLAGEFNKLQEEGK